MAKRRDNFAGASAPPPPAGARSASSKAELDERFAGLYRDHLRDVYSFAYYRVRNHHDAEDLTEQVFVQAYRHFARALAESDGRSLRPWLIRIAQNLAINLYRDRARRPQTPLEAAGDLSAADDTADIVERRERLAAVLDAVDRLPEGRREALIMRFALGMDNREIARALGRSEGATKLLIHRSLRRLEERLADAGEPGAVALNSPEFGMGETSGRPSGAGGEGLDAIERTGR